MIEALVALVETPTFHLYDASTWSAFNLLAYVVFIISALELLSALVLMAVPFFPAIPVRGKALERLAARDIIYISINKTTAAMFAYHMLQYCWFSGKVGWRLEDLSLASTLVAWVMLHVVYDFFYTIFHRILHLRSIYAYVHKHHHQQHAPSRGNLDAVNVHLFEFLTGEYMHLLALYLVSTFVAPVHVATVVWFVLMGGVMASLNHTRADLTIGFFYSVKVHDAHHRVPTVNYGQYIMLWDRLMGSYVPYEKSFLVKNE